MGLSEKYKISIFLFAPYIAAYIAALYRRYENAKPVNYIGDKGAKKLRAKELASALLSGMYPKGYVLDLKYYLIGDQGAKALGTALASGNYPEGLVLNLGWNSIGDKGAKALAAALASGMCPKGLVLNLEWNTIGDEGAKALARALAWGNYPEGFELKLRGNVIGHTGARAFAAALASGKCPEGLVLDLSWSKKNYIGDTGAIAIAAALESGKCPEGLELDLSWSEIGDEGKAALETALKSGKVRYGTRIVGLDLEQLCIYNDTNITRTSLVILSSSQIPALRAPHKRAPEFLAHEVAKYLPKPPPTKVIDSIIHSIDSIIKRKTIDDDLKQDYLKSMRSGSEIDLSFSGCGVKEAKALAAVLESGLCPERLVLKLLHGCIGIEGKAALETALKSGKVPYGTKIVGVGLEQLCRYNDQQIKEKRRALTSIYHSHVSRSNTSNSNTADYIRQQTLSSKE